MLITLLTALLQAEKIPVPDSRFEIELVAVPGGKVRLGSPDSEAGRDADEGPVREVELKPFWMSRTEATWESFVEYYERREQSKVDGVTRPSPPYEPPNGPMGTGRHCAVGMRWHGAVGFCAWLSKKTGHKFRLPTEAEWEHAARAGSAEARPGDLDAAAWHAGNSGKKTKEVGGRAANPFGLHDMLGNVWEYCLEPYAPGSYNPVVRGGAWHSEAAKLRFADRQVILPEWYSRDPNLPRSLWWLTDARFIGFRVLRMGPAAAQAAQAAYAPKVSIAKLEKGKSTNAWTTVTGEIANAGDRELREVELTIFFIDAEGREILEDNKARATFTVAYPVLANSWHGGEAAAPLKPGGTRKFSVAVPEPYEIDEMPPKVGARVTGVRFAE